MRMGLEGPSTLLTSTVALVQGVAKPLMLPFFKNPIRIYLMVYENLYFCRKKETPLYICEKT